MYKKQKRPLHSCASILNSYLQDGILIENMFDIPYLHHKYIGPETVATMSRIGTEIKKLTEEVPCGVQVKRKKTLFGFD